MIKIIADKLNDISMRNKLLFSYIFVVFLPVIIVGLIFTGNMKGMMLEQAANAAVSDVDRIENRLREIFKLGTDISNNLYVDKDMLDILEKEYGSVQEVYNDYQAYTEFSNILNNYQEIKSVRIYAYNPTMLDNSFFVPMSGDVSASGWFEKAVECNGRASWRFIDGGGDGGALSLARLVKDAAGKPLGVLVIGLKGSYISSFLSHEEFDAYVIDEAGTVVAAKDSGLEGRSEASLDFGSHEDIDAASLLSRIPTGKDSVLITRTFTPERSNSGIRIMTRFSAEAITARANRAGLIGFAIIAGCLTVSLLFILLFTRALSRRVTRLNCDIGAVAEGNFDIRTSVHGWDEIGRLSYNLQIMAKSIKELIRDVYEANLQRNALEIRQKEIRLRILANQVNPHFLFNVLELIRMKAHAIGGTDIVRIVKMLGNIMRSSLDAEAGCVSLEKELELVENYLEIQKLRFNDRINYRIDIRDPIEGVRILPFIVQPVVENSVLHGLEGKVGAGMIRIDVARAGGGLRILVQDDGAGISADRLRRLLDSFGAQEEAGRHIGLRNVYQRIKLHYGDAYGLSIVSELNRGTAVEILLPDEGEKDAEATAGR